MACQRGDWLCVIRVLQAMEDISLCHKISLADPPSGVPLKKYGETIAITTGAILCGG